MQPEGLFLEGRVPFHNIGDARNRLCAEELRDGGTAQVEVEEDTPDLRLATEPGDQIAGHRRLARCRIRRGDRDPGPVVPAGFEEKLCPEDIEVRGLLGRVRGHDARLLQAALGRLEGRNGHPKLVKRAFGGKHLRLPPRRKLGAAGSRCWLSVSLRPGFRQCCLKLFHSNASSLRTRDG